MSVMLCKSHFFTVYASRFVYAHPFLVSYLFFSFFVFHVLLFFLSISSFFCFHNFLALLVSSSIIFSTLFPCGRVGGIDKAEHKIGRFISCFLTCQAMYVCIGLYSIHFWYIPGVPKKTRNGGFSVPCFLKVVYFLKSSNKASSAEENDAKIIKFGSVLFILRPFLEM